MPSFTANQRQPEDYVKIRVQRSCMFLSGVILSIRARRFAANGRYHTSQAFRTTTADRALRTGEVRIFTARVAQKLAKLRTFVGGGSRAGAVELWVPTWLRSAPAGIPAFFLPAPYDNPNFYQCAFDAGGMKDFEPVRLRFSGYYLVFIPGCGKVVRSLALCKQTRH